MLNLKAFAEQSDLGSYLFDLGVCVIRWGIPEYLDRMIDVLDAVADVYATELGDKGHDDLAGAWTKGQSRAEAQQARQAVLRQLTKQLGPVAGCVVEVFVDNMSPEKQVEVFDELVDRRKQKAQSRQAK